MRPQKAGGGLESTMEELQKWRLCLAAQRELERQGLRGANPREKAITKTNERSALLLQAWPLTSAELYQIEFSFMDTTCLQIWAGVHRKGTQAADSAALLAFLLGIVWSPFHFSPLDFNTRISTSFQTFSVMFLKPKMVRSPGRWSVELLFWPGKCWILSVWAWSKIHRNQS